MKCPDCGSEITGAFCSFCGRRIEAPRRDEALYVKLRSILVDGRESIKAVLGNTWAQNFFLTGMLSNAFAVLSDKRVYFKGKCLIRKKKGFESRLEEKTVDLKDVTGTGFLRSSALWAKKGSIIFLIAALACFSLGFLGYGFEEGFLLLFILGIPLMVMFGVFRVLYNRNTYYVFEIAYAGGGIAFDLRWITEEEAKEFQRQVVLLKQKEQAEKEVSAKEDGIPEQLRKYKELLDASIITFDEFEEKKRQLLGISGVSSSPWRSPEVKF